MLCPLIVVDDESGEDELDRAEEEFDIRLVDSDPRLAPFRFRVVIFSARLELELECVEVTEDNW